jgi:hypothetical protein
MSNVLGDDFTLVTPETLRDYIPEGTLHESYRNLPLVALKTDAIRVALLATHGGWWWDADTVALCKPTMLPDDRPLYATWTNPPRRVLNGYVHLPKETAGGWLEQVNHRLADGQRVSWCDLGEGLLSDVLATDPRSQEIPLRLLLPIDIDSGVRRFFLPGDPKDHITEDTICFGLNYSFFMYHHRDVMMMPEETWGESPLLIHRLLDLARSQS